MYMSKLAAQLVNFDTPENLVGEPYEIQKQKKKKFSHENRVEVRSFAGIF